MECALGKETAIFIYQGNRQQLEEWEGHGIALLYSLENLQKEEYAYCKDIGCVFASCETLVSTTGGCSVAKGDIIVHNPRLCAVGIKRYLR